MVKDAVDKSGLDQPPLKVQAAGLLAERSAVRAAWSHGRRSEQEECLDSCPVWALLTWDRVVMSDPDSSCGCQLPIHSLNKIPPNKMCILANQNLSPPHFFWTQFWQT